MKVTVEDLSSVKKILHIEIPEADVTRELDDAYRTLKKNAKIKGFRPGKAPRSVLERLFKKDVHSDTSSKLIQNSFMEAIQETGLNIVGTPQIDPPEIVPQSDYRYDASVEIPPEIGSIDFKGLELKRTVYSVGDEELDTQLKMLQKNLAQRKTIDTQRPAADKDFVLIDYEGFENDEPFAETQRTENFLMQIGRGTVAEELDQQIIGMMPGEHREVTVTFADDHANTALAGHTVVFHVDLKEIREEVLPEIDDELAKRLGEFKTLDDLKTAITDNLMQGYDKRTEQEMNEQIFQALIDKTDFEVPDTLVDMELDGILREAERSFAAQGLSLEQLGMSRDNLSEKYRPTAEKQVRRHLILNAIIKQEELSLSDEEIEKGYQDMAETSRQPIDDIKGYYKQNKESLDFFKHTLLEKKAIGLIIDQGTVTDVEPEKAPDTSEKMPKASDENNR